MGPAREQIPFLAAPWYNMRMTRYVALLRGINVGGRNLITMSELRACFDREGFEGVATYIQSGNVLFTASEPGRAGLARRIEAALTRMFGCSVSVLLRSRPEMRRIVERAPTGFGAHSAKYRYDVIFLKAPLTASSAVRNVPTRPGVDEANAGRGVLYFSRLISRASESQLSRLVSLPVYQAMTIRNWSTTTTLLRLLDGSEK
jgi:uncharacterized protein (DUF1697 family)